MKEKEKIKKIKMEKYKTRFNEIHAWQAMEKSNVNLGNGEKYEVEEGEFFILLDKIKPIKLKEEDFKNLFIKEK